MKKVLIALDYNPSAQKVAETGYALATSMNAKAILLHVISDLTYYSSVDYSPVMGYVGFSSLVSGQEYSVKEMKVAAADYLYKTKQHLGDNGIQTVVSSGDYGDTILKTAKELEVDVIVMGTHSRRGLEKIFLGSVAENVLRHSPVPMFIIPTRDINEGSI